MVNHQGVDVGALDYFPHRDSQRLFDELGLTPRVELVDARRAYNPDTFRHCSNLKQTDLWDGWSYLSQYLGIFCRHLFGYRLCVLNTAAFTKNHQGHRGNLWRLWQRVAENIEYDQVHLFIRVQR